MKKHMELIWIGIIVGLCGIAIISDIYMGPDNVIEEFSEEMAEQTIEHEFNLPEDSLEGTIDFSPGSKET